jgi:hypothetical protein
MMQVVRPARPPRLILAAWLAACVIGAGLIAWPSNAGNASNALSLDTLTSYLAHAAGPHAHDIRVNSVYGSAHDSAWQFIAHLTWHDDDGVIHGGSTELPVLAGSRTQPSPFGADRLRVEESMGWSLAAVRSRLNKVRTARAGITLIDLQITDTSSLLVACTATRAGTGHCTSFNIRGQTVESYDAEITDDPSAGALSVAHTP